MIQDQQKLVAAAVKRLETLKRESAFDPAHPESLPTPAQQEVIDDFGKVKTQWIVAANQSGKTQTCCRLVSWVASDTHPSWSRPKEWANEDLLILIMGRTGKQLEESIWPKIKGYLAAGSFKEIRLGNILQRVEIIDGKGKGNRLLFQSLENPNVAAERIQSYVAHLVFIDEMPPTEKVLAEAMVRRNSRDGYFLASFTPLVVNTNIRKAVDAAALPLSKKYKFRMFDNPVYASPERQAQILESMAHLPEHVRNTRLFGDWSVNDDAVYYFDYEKMVEFPLGYSRLWRHMEIVDPALKSALGLIVVAENPTSGVWYAMHAEKIRGIHTPSLLVEAVKERTKDYNIIRRRSDPHEVWYIQTAAEKGLQYEGVYKKNERKHELIKTLQECLGSRFRIAPHCEELIQELQECRWSDQAEGKIVNSSSFHLLDCAQYFCDNIPKPEQRIESSSWQDWLWQSNEVRKQKKEKQMKAVEKRMTVSRRSRWSR